MKKQTRRKTQGRVLQAEETANAKILNREYACTWTIAKNKVWLQGSRGRWEDQQGTQEPAHDTPFRLKNGDMHEATVLSISRGKGWKTPRSHRYLTTMERESSTNRLTCFYLFCCILFISLLPSLLLLPFPLSLPSFLSLFHEYLFCTYCA